MTTNFPTGLDDFSPYPSPSSKRNNPSLAGRTNNLADAVRAIETTIGITDSEDTNSLQYKIAQLQTTQGTGPITAFPTSLDVLPYSAAVAALEARVGVTNSTVQTSLTARIYARPLVWAPPYSPASNGTEGVAWKGNIFTPAYNMTLYGLRIYSTAYPASATVQGAVITVSGGLIATQTLTDVFTNAATPGVQSPQIDLVFASPVSLTSGIAYGLMGGYSSTAGSVTTGSSFPAFISQRLVWQSIWPRPGTLSSSVYHQNATLTPVVGTAVTTVANSQNSGFSTYLICPIFDRA